MVAEHGAVGPAAQRAGAVVKNLLILFMAMMAQQPEVMADGDAAFYRVDTRTPAHELPKGVCADAVNKRFEDGRAWPRFNVENQPWGVVPAGLNVCTGHQSSSEPDEFGYFGKINGLVVGATYYYAAAGNITLLEQLGGELIQPGMFFVATGRLGFHMATPNTLVTGVVYRVSGPNCFGFARFNDPEGLDVLVLATDDWRNQPGEDGGRGRVWKILANNAPVEVPLNGSDVDGTCRFVPCFNALVLLRHGSERHYFNAAAVGNPAANKIQLNCAPAWNNGDGALLWGDATVNSQINGTSAPVINSFVFVQNLGNNVVALFNTQNDALNNTNPLNFTDATGRFYLERRAGAPGAFGNGAPPLLAQPNVQGNTLWEVGFKAVPVNLQVTNTTAATGVWTVPNHRLNPGDKITLANMPGGHTPANGDYYAYPVSDHALQLFDTEENALLAATGSVAGLKAISNDGENLPTMAKANASGLPMPPATEGFYTENQRLVLVNGNSLLISDPLDPLHYTPMQATISANLGESDLVTCVSSFIAADCLVIGKQKSILAIYNFSGGPAAWVLRSVTREYGCIAPLSMRQWGNLLVFLSRRGLDSVELSSFGVIVPAVKPVSFALQKYVNLLDWNAAADSVVETWSNRLFWSVKLKGQPGTANNALLVLNFLNSEVNRGIFGWEGVWLGNSLTAQGLAKHTIAGEERLALLNAAGLVGWLGDGTLDQPGNLPIADSLTTRIYTGGEQTRKIFNKALCIWDTNHALLTVTAVTPGYNELTVLTPAGGLAYNALAYGAGLNTSYDPATQQPAFNTPLREDYALQNVTELIGGVPDVLQNHSEPFRMREDDWGVQLVIANARGAARLVAVSVAAFMGPSSDRSRV